MLAESCAVIVALDFKTCWRPVLTNVSRAKHVFFITVSGIGSRTALHLAKMGATVVMACRSVEKGEEARVALEKEIRLEKSQ